MNHALTADYLHVRERLGLDHGGNDATAARSYARQAGREAAIAGETLGEASGHISRFGVLSHEYAKGFAEAESVLISGLDTTLVTECFNARTDMDKAIQEQDRGAVYGAMQSIFSIAADYPGVVPPFFSDIPEVNQLVEAAATWRLARKGLEEAAVRRAEWEALLPSAIELKKQVETEANGAGESFDFEGYTLWHEPEFGGWSLTNAYGVDNCAFLASEDHFQWLLDAVKKGDEIGPVPPMCQDPSDDDSDHPDGDAMSACAGAAVAVIDRLKIAA
jgi:hypothetical protein